MKKKSTVRSEISPQLTGVWNAVLEECGQGHDLGQTPEWCALWAQAYPEAWKRLVVIEQPDAVYPLMIRQEVGLRVLVWIGQRGGMMSDYSGGAGSYSGLLDALIDLDGWDVADLQLSHWQPEAGALLKSVLRYEKYLWRVDVSDQSVAIDLPDTFDAWLASLGRTPRRSARECVKNADDGIVRFEILSGEEMLFGLDELIDNNRMHWEVLHQTRDADFLRHAVAALTKNPHLFLARLADESGSPAACLGYASEGSVYLHTAGICRETFHGMAPGIAMYTLLVRELIRRNMRVLDFCPGLEEYKFRLGGHWVPGHRLLFARNRRAYIQYRSAESIGGLGRSCRDLAGRLYRRRQRR